MSKRKSKTNLNIDYSVANKSINSKRWQKQFLHNLDIDKRLKKFENESFIDEDLKYLLNDLYCTRKNLLRLAYILISYVDCNIEKKIDILEIVKECKLNELEFVIKNIKHRMTELEKFSAPAVIVNYERGKLIRCERELNKLENIEDEEILEQIKNNIINSFTKLLFDEIQGHTNTIYNKPTNIHLKNFDESQGILEKNFEEFWDNINIHAGQEFFTKTNREFTYNVEGEYLIASDKKVFIPKVNFHQAFNVWPVDGPGSLPKNIMGKSYVWGICEDNRSWIDNRLDWFLN